MAEDRFLLDSPAIEKAVAFHNSADYPPRRPGKNSLDDVPAMGGSGYNGMFAVTDNGDGTLTINGGYVDLHAGSAPELRQYGYIDTKTEKIQFVEAFVVIAAKWNQEGGGRWDLSFIQNEFPRERVYIPGEQIYFELAFYKRIPDSNYVRYEFTQLWQGGMIPFKTRYYVEK